MQDNNYPNIEDIPGMQPQDVAELPASVLSDLQNKVLAQSDLLKKQIAALDAGITIKYAARVKSAYLEKGVDTGKAHIVDDGIGIELEIPKSVSWDQDGLRDELSKMEPETARHYGKIKFEVPEAKFSSAPPDIKGKLDGLRTVKPGKMKIRFEQAED